jgi:transposase
VPTTTEGYEKLIYWAGSFGSVRYAGVEGTSSYGAGLARHLKAAGVAVMEVERPKRHHRRRNGKSDPKDAEAAARAVLAGEAVGEPKSGDGRVEMIRVLRAARQSAVKARSQAANQLKSLRVTAPEEFRQRLHGLSTKELVAIAARFRPSSDLGDVEMATKFALSSVARRYEALSKEIARLDAQLDQLVAEVASGLVSLPAIGTNHAATLLVAAGDNPERLRSEASFASLCSVSSIEASSGRVVRHRLNRGGNRDANRALHMICVV